MQMVDHMMFDENENWCTYVVTGGAILAVRNAPSPAATSCLAIAKEIADQAQQVFHLPPPLTISANALS